jgi:hypothetical protein
MYNIAVLNQLCSQALFDSAQSARMLSGVEA